MNPDVLSFAQVAIVIVALTGSLVFIGVVAFRAIVKPKRDSVTLHRMNDEQLERLQQSVDAIALEVERIAEAQRFSAKLMSERSARSSLHS